MKINENVSFSALMGLIQRANTDERLQIADDWLRANKAVTNQQYHELRDVWDKMVQAHGTHKIVISCGSVKHDYMSGLSYKEALRICRDSRWQHNHNNGCMWDMEIEWEG